MSLAKTRGRDTTMADESKNDKKPDDTKAKQGIADVPNVDDLLSQANESLSEVESELGVDANAADAKPAATEGSKQVDEAMKTVEDQAQALSHEVSPAVAVEQASSEEKDAETGGVDDVLASLAGELDDLGGDKDSDAAVDEAAAPDEIDEVLSGLSGEVEALEGQPEAAGTEEVSTESSNVKDMGRWILRLY